MNAEQFKRRESGIYKIICLANGKVYIGSAVNIGKRWRSHFQSLNSGRHNSRHLLHAWQKYGATAFIFEMLESVNRLDILIEREQHWIDFYKASNAEFGFNLSPTAGSQRGLKFSDASKAKMSEKRRGRKLPEAWREAIAAGLRGKKRPEHVKEALRKYRTGKKHSPEQRRKLSESHKGIVRSENWRLNLSRALKGKTKSVEHIAKMAKKHRALTDEQVSEMVSDFTAGESLTKIGKRFGVSQETVCNNFKRVGFDYKPLIRGRLNSQKLTEKDVLEIQQLHRAGKSIRELSSMFKVHFSTVYGIIIGKTWTHLRS